MPENKLCYNKFMKKIKNLFRRLQAGNITLACAESCSGGYLSYLLTKIPGSSKVFKGGVIVYSLEAKQTFLGLPRALLAQTQGVSAQVAQKLARQIRKKLKSSLGISIVGAAGPGKVKTTAAGTVFIALAGGKKTITKKCMFKGGRDAVRKAASKEAIVLLYKFVGVDPCADPKL